MSKIRTRDLPHEGKCSMAQAYYLGTETNPGLTEEKKVPHNTGLCFYSLCWRDITSKLTDSHQTENRTARRGDP